MPTARIRRPHYRVQYWDGVTGYPLTGSLYGPRQGILILVAVDPED